MGRNRTKNAKHGNKAHRPSAPSQNAFSEGAASRKGNAGGLSTAELLAITYAHTPRGQTSDLLSHYTGRILLVGEGDFSFSAALLAAYKSAMYRPTGKPDPKILATSLDTREELATKYGGRVNTVLAGLVKGGHTVLHGVDAARLSEHPELSGQSFDCIVFNFPHISGAKNQKEDVKRNRKLLRAFFGHALRMLTDRGRIIVALRSTPFYDSWRIEKLAAPVLVLDAKEKFPGDIWLTLNYAPVRTNPAMREAPSLDQAFNYVFRAAKPGEVLDLSSDEEEEEDEEEVESDDGEEEQKAAPSKSSTKIPAKPDWKAERERRKKERKQQSKPALDNVRGGRVTKKRNK